METPTLLERIGLSAREAAVYIACLEHGPENISAIARFAGQKRSTVHYTIEGLLARGLLILQRKGKRSLYDAQRPQRLLTIAREYERALEGLMPKLEALRSPKQPNPKIQVYEGQAGFLDLYREIYEHAEKPGGIDFLTAIEDLQEHAPFVLDMYMERLSNAEQYHVRELLWDTSAGRRWLKLERSRSLGHPCRLLPSQNEIRNDFAIFGDRVAIFSFRKRLSAVVIEDRDVVQTMRTMYECAWAGAVDAA